MSRRHTSRALLPNARLPLSSTEVLTTTGVLAAAAIALSALESGLPPLPIPGARLGLASLASVSALAICGMPSALAVAVIKTVFVWLTRGVTAAMMTGAGTLLSLLVTAALLPLMRRQLLSFVGVSVAGAAAHNLSQIGVAVWLLGSGVWYYLPLLLLAAALCGTLTGLLLNAVLPRIIRSLIKRSD
ncbi:MAG: Gx transporter family protein [Clostridia bacterium]|nr:Gx transporter family protein [Clostridia bacterium]